jgi:hypothetical protein
VEGIEEFNVNLKNYSNEIIELRYEDLLDNPQKQLSRICDFIDLEFDKRMLQLESSCDIAGDTEGNTGIVKNNKQKFLTKMSIKQRESLERIAKPVLEKYGYQVEYTGKYKRVNNIQMFIFKVMDTISLFQYESKKRGFIRGIIFQWNLYRTTN